MKTHKNIMYDVSKTMCDFYHKQQMMNVMCAPIPFTSGVEVEEIVPKHYISIPIPYIQKSYNDEGDRNEDQWVFGFIWRTLFTFGKKVKNRFLYSWEAVKKELEK